MAVVRELAAPPVVSGPPWSGTVGARSGYPLPEAAAGGSGAGATGLRVRRRVASRGGSAGRPAAAHAAAPAIRLAAALRAGRCMGSFSVSKDQEKNKEGDQDQGMLTHRKNFAGKNFRVGRSIFRVGRIAPQKMNGDGSPSTV
jgi:hypothetical protein